ncbi:MAG: nickel-dependent lactate racemase [Deltaproteobacteria bacterium]|nr:nickel-dependent lactate racemase [Deltaproteobacteria bacterium]
MPDEIRVPFGKAGDLSFTLPANWTLDKICDPKEVAPCEDVAAEARRAVREPVGAPPLAECVTGAKKICVVVDDVSRPTPAHLFFDHVLREIESAGIAPDQITVITALGVHRAMTDAEIANKIGDAGAARYRVENHNAEPGDHLVRLGRTSRGSEVYVNRHVAEADVTVSLGCIEPHVIAGFGGGYKNIFPGCAGKQTVAANHALNTTPATFNMVGSRPENNPMRCDLEECGRMVSGRVFIVNAVLDGFLRVARIVAGDPVAAHREGIKTSQEIFGVRIDKRCDVLITCSHPMNIDLRQGVKALANTIQAVRPGGVLINLVAAEEGLGEFPMPKKRLPVGKRGVRALARVLLPLVGRFTFGMKEEDLFFIYFALQAFKRNDIYFYSPNVPAEFTDRVPLFEISKTIEETLAKAHRAMPGPASVLVFPRGAITYPIIE